MFSGRYIDIENDVLRSRLDTIKSGAQALIEAVQRYVQPRKGEFCSRTELLNTINELKKKLK